MTLEVQSLNDCLIALGNFTVDSDVDRLEVINNGAYLLLQAALDLETPLPGLVLQNCAWLMSLLVKSANAAQLSPLGPYALRLARLGADTSLETKSDAFVLLDATILNPGPCQKHHLPALRDCIQEHIMTYEPKRMRIETEMSDGDWCISSSISIAQGLLEGGYLSPNDLDEDGIIPILALILEDGCKVPWTLLRPVCTIFAHLLSRETYPASCIEHNVYPNLLKLFGTLKEEPSLDSVAWALANSGLLFLPDPQLIGLLSSPYLSHWVITTLKSPEDYSGSRVTAMVAKFVCLGHQLGMLQSGAQWKDEDSSGTSNPFFDSLYAEIDTWVSRDDNRATMGLVDGLIKILSDYPASGIVSDSLLPLRPDGVQ